MARRSSETKVSLFPFLAVLVCTMGALILLLLVTTRRIRHDQVRHIDVATAMTDSAASAEGVSVIPDVKDFVISPSRDSASSDDSQEQENVVRLQQLRTELDAELAQQERLNQQIAAAQEKLSLEDSASQEYQRQLKDFSEMSIRRDEEKSQLAMKIRRLADLQEDLDEASKTTEQAQKMLRTRQSALISLRKLAAESAESDAGVASTIIEFSNSTGTQRSPIIVNVTEHGYEFLPSGVRITTKDLQGFPANDNPLIAGVLAIHRTRTKNSTATKPYVLLLVRSSGSLLFYAAQRSLTDVDIHFGYELLEEDRPIAAGRPDPDEEKAIRESLAAAISRRQNRYGDLLSQLQAHNAASAPAEGNRKARVLPDGRVLLPGETDPDENNKFYAGGSLPGPEWPVAETVKKDGGNSQVPETGDTSANPAFVNANPRDQSGEKALFTDEDDQAFSTTLADERLKAQAAIDAALKKLAESERPVPSLVKQSRELRTRAGMISENMGAGSGRVIPSANNLSDAVDSVDARSVGNSSSTAKVTADLPASVAEPGNVSQSNPQTPSGWPALVTDTTDEASRTAGSAEELVASAIASAATRRDSSQTGGSAETPGGNAALTTGASTASKSATNTGNHGTTGTVTMLDQFLADNAKASQQADPYLKSLLQKGSSGIISRHVVTIRLDQHHLSVGELNSHDTAGWNDQQMLAAALQDINQEIRQIPPTAGSSALPLAHFIVSPGANAEHIRLERELIRMGIPCRSSVALTQLSSTPLFEGALQKRPTLPVADPEADVPEVGDAVTPAELQEPAEPREFIRPPRLDRRLAI